MTLGIADVRAERLARVRSTLAFRRISAIYAFAVIIAVFSIWIPNLFLTSTTLRTLLDEQAITATLAVGLTIPLAAAAYDLSIGYTLGLSTVLAAWLLTTGHFSPVAAVLLATLAGGAVGVANGFVVTRLHVDAFITTLGMGSVAFAITEWISNDQVLIGFPESFSTFANGQLFGVQYSVYYMLALALVVWYVLTYTPWGRHTYAVGGNIEAARLSGVRVRLITLASLAAGALIAGFAGVVLTSQTAAGSPSVAPDYLLPAYAAVFLGSTQFGRGVVNVWGTVISVFLLATGVKGLELVGAPFWIPDLFNGAALIIAVALSKELRMKVVSKRFRRQPPAVDAVPAAHAEVAVATLINPNGED